MGSTVRGFLSQLILYQKSTLLFGVALQQSLPKVQAIRSKQFQNTSDKLPAFVRAAPGEKNKQALDTQIPSCIQFSFLEGSRSLVQPRLSANRP